MDRGSNRRLLHGSNRISLWTDRHLEPPQCDWAFSWLLLLHLNTFMGLRSTFFNAGIDFRRPNLTSKDVRFVKLVVKLVPALKRLNQHFCFAYLSRLRLRYLFRFRSGRTYRLEARYFPGKYTRVQTEYFTPTQ